MVVKAGVLRAYPVTHLTAPRERDEHHVACPGLGAHLPAYLVAVHRRHADVQDHDVGLEIQSRGQGGAPVIDLTHRVAVLAQQFGECSGAVAVIVRYQYLQSVHGH